MSETRRQQIADVVRRHALTIIEDDSYGLLARNTPPALASLAPDITIYLGGLSKVLTPALRVTYMVVPDAWMAERLAGALRAVSQMTPPLMLALASHWILEGTATRLLSSLRDEAVTRQRLATSRLPRASVKTAPEAYHLWLQLPEGWQRAAFVRHLQRQNIAVVASDSFAVSDHAPEAVRLCLGAATDRTSLDLALTAVAVALTEPAGRPVPAVV
jgi:DNA-binding transcriptional MocR family regulator